ncbi:diguanylate cyclase domain-containing protein [Sphingomonas sp. SAFR-052]|uniref:GGDEF domain-containing protein n=1 Tax=Sphingomonas sp. SAFR-052 TaxID=3436867 RepID=UPI003F81A0B3
MIALLMAFGAFAAVPARAQAGIVGTSVATCISRVEPGDTVRGVLARPDRFDCTTRQTSFGPGDYWVLSGRLPKPADPAAPIRLRQASLWQDSLAVYAIAADGRIAEWIDDNVGIGRHIQLGAIVEHRFVPDGAPIERVLWRVDGSANMRGILLGARVTGDAESERSNLLLAALYAGFIGLCAGLLFYNFALWRVLHHDFQIAYCGLLACLVIYALSSSGILAWFLPELGNNRRILTSYVVLSWGMASALTFCACFFERRILDGWPLRLVQTVIAVFATIGALLIAVGPVAIAMLDRLYSLAMFVAPVVVGLVVWHAWQRRSDYLWLFAISWASPMAMLIVRSLYNLNLLAWSFWIDNSTLVAMSIETLTASIAIAYRIRVLSRERDEAVRQEAISRELADTDPLTGLLNRRAFLSRAIAAEGPRTLMLFDIDHFKQVNDTIGHDGGDEVLRQFARTLRFHAPPGVLVARMGGEEFALLGQEGAMPDPDVLLANVRAQRLPYDLRVTSSIGICHGPLADDNDWKRLYRLADKALFEAKAAGRDRAGRAPSLPLAA